MEEYFSELIEYANDEDLLDEIMTKYGQRILELAYSYVGDQSLAEDLTQEIFVKCYKAIHTYNRQSKIKTWLWRIAINHCKDYLRSWYHRKVMITEKITSYAGASKYNVEKTIEVHEDGKKLAQAVLQLPVKYREVVYLHYYEDLSFKEISSIININENTIKTRMRRAKQLLRQELEGIEIE
ncbi:sigma-70 family RNA polymerase sigma factor [Bacillus massiliigorillae]|uniref:sigma-70 family RNA polymerase sigma factor n=1 Tax=Bacillus massiliigorillae TaxID=1243664 RepID=UPI0003A83E87|nr:sigma-70 family RNA polymerase sigma factor [Bacillus massiliigorillae]